MTNEQDVKQESSSALAEAIASSPEVTEELQKPQAETATPKEAEQEVQEEQQETEQAPFNQHPRFQELIAEKNYFKQMAERLSQQSQQPIQQPTQDPDAGKTAEERVFWQQVDERADRRAEAKLARLSPVLEAARMELAQMKVAQFRASHPDIKSNSPEEMMIAEKIQAGYNPDDAYWAVKGPLGEKKGEEKGKQQVKQQMVAKKMANVESTASLSPQAQSQGNLSFEEEMCQKFGIPVPYKMPPLKKR